MFNIIEKLSNVFSLGQAADPTRVSDKLKESILSNLDDGEELIHIIRNSRAFYNAKAHRDKNTYYNSRCILTNRRFLIIRNLDYFKLFREIQLPKITDHKIEKSKSEVIITLISETGEDVIEFSKNMVSFAEEFSDIFSQTLKVAMDKYSINKEGKIEKKCDNCGKFIAQETKFCSDCGHKFY